MEKFTLFFRGSDVYQPDQSPEALQALKVKMMDWLTDLTVSGLHDSSVPLQPIGKQVNGISQTIIEQPYGIGRDILGGCTIVLAKSFDEAVEIAKACPILETHAIIEVRPLQII